MSVAPTGSLRQKETRVMVRERRSKESMSSDAASKRGNGGSEGRAAAADAAPPSTPPPFASASLLIYLTITLYALAYMSQQPTKIFWVGKVTADKRDAAEAYAAYESYFALLQLVGGLISGWLVDAIGAKFMIMLSLLSGFASYALTAHASTLLGLFCAGVPTVMQHAMLASRSYLTATLDSSQHATVIGRLGVAYGVGMVIGPQLGGWVASWSLVAAALLAAGISLVSALIVWAALPNAKPSDGALDKKPAGAASSSISYAALLQIPSVKEGLLVKALFFLGSELFRQLLTQVAVKHFRFEPSDMGTLLSIVGFSSALANLLPPALAGFHVPSLLCACCVGMTAVISTIAMLPSSAALLVKALCLPHAMMGALFGTLQTTLMTSATPPSLQGSLSGLDMSLRSVIGICTPFAAQALLSAFGYAALFTPAVIFSLLVFLILAAGSCGSPMGSSGSHSP